MRISKDPALRREDLLNAARDAFLKEGYANTTVDMIVQKAGVAKGSFYNYFKSKDDVMEAVITKMAEDIMESIKGVFTDAHSSPKEKLRNYIELTFRMADTQDDSFHHLHDAAHSSTGELSMKQMHDRAIDDFTAMMIPIVKEVLEEGQANGEFSILHADFTAIAISGAFKQLHVSFYETPYADFAQAKVYIYDFLSRILQTEF